MGGPLGSDPATEKTDPIKISLFGLEAIVQAENPLFDLIEQASRFELRSAGFHEKFTLIYVYSIRGSQAC